MVEKLGGNAAARAFENDEDDELTPLQAFLTHASLEAGVACFDSAVAGLGGCPYAPGASGNVATEDVVYMLDGLGIETGISLDALVDTAGWISERLGRPPASKVARAVLAKRAKACH